MGEKISFILFVSFVLTACDSFRLGNLEEALKKKPPGVDSREFWIEVPANAGGMGLPAFFVMKFEAKAMLESDKTINSSGLSIDTSTHRAVSVESHSPWRDITAIEAASECEALGDGFRLISNEEWMALARDIEAQNTNWSGGVVGAGCLFRGNSGEVACGYDGDDPESGISRNARSKFRLSNGEEIYDLAGNVNEWVDWDSSTPGLQLGPTTCPNSGWEELSGLGCAGLSSNDYTPLNTLYNNTDEAVGLFFGGAGGAAMRGGSSGSTDKTALYTLLLYFNTSYTSQYGGFRCVYRKS